MAALKSTDLLKLEKLFGMSGGYVLDFSNAKFKQFMDIYSGVDIYNDKYALYGESKGKRLKAFWEIESDETVGKSISYMVDHWRTMNMFSGSEVTSSQEELAQECNNIANRLLCKKMEQASKSTNDFTEAHYSTTQPVDTENINTFKLFISHKDDNKKLANELKEALEVFGISSFIAHEDIEPSTEWQNEIEKALFSMDALLALLSSGFSESVWTNQEVGVAFGRGVFILSVKAVENPKGFVGKFQALRPKNSDVNDLASKIAEQLMKNPRTIETMKSAYIHALSKCSSFAEAERWALLLPFVNSLSHEQAAQLLKNYNSNSQVYECFSLNGGRYNKNKNMADYLNEWVNNKRYKLQDKRLKETS